MNKEEILRIFDETKVRLKGHFLLSSGRHSDTYMQCAKLFVEPKYSVLFAKELSLLFKEEEIDYVIGPALGGIILAYEVAKQLKCKNLFAERENGVMTLRRGFELTPDSRVLVVEDVITTGGSVKEVMEMVNKRQATVLAVGALIDRSGSKVDFGVPLKSLIQMDIQTYAANDCELCKSGSVAIKPGSNSLIK